MSAHEQAPAGAVRTWSVGELAAATGLTVRALHHYDEVGLLTPTLRSSAGHRRYTAADVRRLHRVTALRGFGFTLAQIGQVLDDADLDVRELVRRQLDQVHDRIARAHRLRDGLNSVLTALDSAAEPSAPMLIQLIEVMTAVERSYIPEELQKMADNRRAMTAQLSPQQLAELSQRRQAYFDTLSPEQVAELRQRRGLPAPGGQEG
ncbi:MerR family transcriptional regulator [Planosporangium thailandense]|uniref:MerR family transcriptional regulator n=1 Tax=Planosporangium thailandense TaxID=765197 RepID=A0ABX0Y199_9ACTN|nr:MerR family transcriptional regulator [Planosporangium thailandense]NJC72134.1 MerR family transcriptional regulator [Planosporangium thailandense]